MGSDGGDDPDRYVPALGRGWLTRVYDPVVRVTTREQTFKRRLLVQAKLADGFSVLDLGCGTGTLAIWAKQARPAARIIGVDGDAEILHKAEHKARQAGCDVRFDRGLSYDLPYPDRTFDRVLSSLFFHHLTTNDKRQTIEEIARVLKPGGELHVADWGRARNVAMKAAFLSVRLIDGFERTRDSVNGALPQLFTDGGLDHAQEREVIPTMVGTLSFYSAVAPY